MYFSDNNHFHKALNQILNRYSLTQTELKKTNLLSNTVIISIAFTEDGGFDKESGEFCSEVLPDTYKLRIYYLPKDGENKQMLVLVPNDYLFLDSKINKHTSSVLE